MVISFGKNLTITDPDVDPAWETKLSLDFEAIALVVKDKYQPRYQFIKEYQGSHTMRIPLTADRCYEYLIAAGWSDGTVNKTEQEFQSYVLKVQTEYNHPPLVKTLEMEKK